MKNTKQKRWVNPYIARFGQTPLTKVKDLYTNLKVELIQKPQITGALKEFVKAGSMTRAPQFTKGDDTLLSLIESKALWQGLETLHFTFKVTGCTRLLTHQLVRHRIGITFSQQCSDSVDWRHHNVLLPSCYLRCENIDTYVHNIIRDKMTYAEVLDKKLMSCQEARYILPQCLETFIYIHVSLATLLPMLNKRLCTMTQPWETVLWARKTVLTLIAAYPELSKFLIPDCEKMRCFYHRAKEEPSSAYLYQPDKEHCNDKFDWNPESYVYDKEHAAMSLEESSIPTKMFHGFSEISLQEYRLFEKEYKLWQ